MTRDERRKAMATAAAEITRNALAPEWARVALAAAAEELAELDARLRELEARRE